MRRCALAAAVVAVSTACGGTPSPDIAVISSRQGPSAIEVRGLPRRDLASVRRSDLSREEWQALLRVSLTGSTVALAGEYTIVNRAIRFTPMYGFEPGRSFTARFDATKVPGSDPDDDWRRAPRTRVFDFAARLGPGRATTVTRVYPSGPVLPENMLRFYIEFSGPMGRVSALEHVRLIDQNGDHVIDPFLPVEAELWSMDRKRFTLLFDPGRVKRGIKPNRDLGRALVPGRRYALVVGDRWTDGRGHPLKSAYRHEFTVGPAVEKPLDQNEWKLVAPPAGGRDPLVVTFPWPLDYALMQRSLGVLRGAAEFPGEIEIDAGETRWRFTPRDPWMAGDYSLLAMTILEDPAGNRIGRAFEVMQAAPAGGDQVLVPFRVR